MINRRTMLVLGLAFIATSLGWAVTTWKPMGYSPSSVTNPPQDFDYGNQDYDRFQDPRARGSRWERDFTFDDVSGDWTIDEEFKHDVFTFARIQYTSTSRGRYRWGREDWLTDYPDSDLNFSYRLQELTALKVNPKPAIVRLDSEEIFNYPFTYLLEAGEMDLTNAEVEGMRKYLLRGGFIMVDDFWGNYEYETLLINLKRVFPDRVPQELPLEHEIFHLVYDLTEKPLIPSIHHFYRGRWTERGDAREPHYLGLFDDDGRMMMIICHNTDLGDGWEREGVDPEYFRVYSERWAYPLGINIITYAMTH